ncbi:MAG: tRNA 2-selenouridine(34) synthase MnmH [Bacteroidales bacterium]|nr:tRNA 2-selenouridine(34) synthase MnmH [Bacteroidales bacterium]
MNQLDPENFLKEAAQLPVVDVRTPAEFSRGHIPGAVNISLFENNERAEVGTLYKQRGRDTAIRKGLEMVGPKMIRYLEKLESVIPHGPVLVHCWRGGMRSESMGWLFETAGYQVSLLKGGYQAYRRYIRKQLGNPGSLVVLGGLTGSGKSRWLKQLKEAGQQVIDLEGLANHKGSVFGWIGMDTQPTNEQFENELYGRLVALNSSLPVWIEDESRQIGRIFIPDTFYQAKSNAPLILIRVPDELRIRILIEEYGNSAENELAISIERIRKRLGGETTKKILEALKRNDLEQVARMLLVYYDQKYTHSLRLRDPKTVYELDLRKTKPENYAAQLIRTLDKLFK